MLLFFCRTPCDFINFIFIRPLSMCKNFHAPPSVPSIIFVDLPIFDPSPTPSDNKWKVPHLLLAHFHHLRSTTHMEPAGRSVHHGVLGRQLLIAKCGLHWKRGYQPWIHSWEYTSCLCELVSQVDKECTKSVHCIPLLKLAFYHCSVHSLYTFSYHSIYTPFTMIESRSYTASMETLHNTPM